MFRRNSTPRSFTSTEVDFIPAECASLSRHGRSHNFKQDINLKSRFSNTRRQSTTNFPRRRLKRLPLFMVWKPLSRRPTLSLIQPFESRPIFRNCSRTLAQIQTTGWKHIRPTSAIHLFSCQRRACYDISKRQVDRNLLVAVKPC
jgi:hypothetical protein